MSSVIWQPTYGTHDNVIITSKRRHSGATIHQVYTECVKSQLDVLLWNPANFPGLVILIHSLKLCWNLVDIPIGRD